MSVDLYNGLIEDLGAEDKDNYVYLDSEGRAQAKADISVKWAKLPKKQILLTLNADSPNRFLKTRITETMEQYSIFSGLKSFEIQNMKCGGQDVDLVLFNQKGQLSDLVKHGNEVTFEVNSSDIWLDMRIECFELSLMLIFEIKVDKKLECGRLKSHLLSIINMILEAKNLHFGYEVKDIKLIKARLNEEVVIVKDSRSSAFDSKRVPKKLHEVADPRPISSEFDYLDRYIICTLQKDSNKDTNVFERRMTINPNTNNIVTTAFESFKESLPCRGIKVESFSFSKHLEVKVHSKELQDPVKQSCCSCQIF